MGPIVGPANRRVRPRGHGAAESRTSRTPGAPRSTGNEGSREAARVDGANPSDPGIGLLARAAVGREPREILLVACGDVPGIGPAATRLVLDVRELSMPGARPLELRTGGPTGFRTALVWPRAHLGKDFTHACLSIGALSCAPHGTLLCAVRKAKGADSIAAFIELLCGNVSVVARDRGYRLLRAEVGAGLSRDVADLAITTRHELGDPVLGDLVLSAVPGVFSRRSLDDGTRALIEHAAATVDRPPARVLDLGAGVGPLACWAARRWTSAHVLAVEPNLLAADCCEHNVRGAALDDRVTVVRAAGLPADDSSSAPGATAARAFAGAVDLALVNPPTHAAPEILARVVSDALAWLAPGGRAMFVVSRASALVAPLRRLGATVSEHHAGAYTVVVASRPC